MNCDEAQRLLPAQASGVLEEEEEALLRAHLQDCPSCQRELGQVGVVFGDLLPGAFEPPPPVWEAIEKAIGQEVVKEVVSPPLPDELLDD